MSTENLVLDEVVTGSPSSRDPNNTSKSNSPSQKASASEHERRSKRMQSPVDNKDRQGIYERDGTNTTSDQPHMQRARLFVGNVPYGLERTELKRIFRRYGTVHGVSIHKGYAFVQMDMERHANDAILGEDGATFKGSKLQVEFSQAAKKAGAKFVGRRGNESRRDRSRSPHRPPRRENRYDDLDEREAKLARMIAMERELQMIRYGRNQTYDRRDYSKDYDRPREYDRSRGYERDHHPPRDYDRPPMKEYGREFERRSFYDPAIPSSVSPPPRKFSRSGSPPKYGHPNESVGYGSKSSDAAPPGWPSGGYNNKPVQQRPWSSEQWH